MFASCTSNNQGATNKDTAEIRAADTGKITGPPIRSLCFLRTVGSGKKDSTTIQLVLKNGKVTGEMNWVPYQKDSRKGTLDGTLKGDSINVVWSFMQEGMKDTLGVQFLLKDSVLLQKPLKLNEKTGREQTIPNADYTIEYSETSKIK